MKPVTEPILRAAANAFDFGGPVVCDARHYGEGHINDTFVVWRADHSKRFILQRINTDTFGDLRLEIRQGTFDGDLRYSVGPEDATRVRVLIRDEAGQYQVRDGEDQAIHEADDFFEAVLQATQENGQNALGYKPGDAEQFREWVMAKSAPPSERRTVLAEPPIRPVAEHETMLLVRGGWLSKEGLTLHERIQDLYPHFSEAEVDNFAAALTEQGEPMKRLEEQENDLNQLRNLIDLWEAQSAGLDAEDRKSVV